MGFDGAELKRTRNKKEDTSFPFITFFGGGFLIVCVLAALMQLFPWWLVLIVVGIVGWNYTKHGNRGKAGKVENEEYNSTRTDEEQEGEREEYYKNDKIIFERINELCTVFSDLISCFVFVCRADGRVDDKEREIITSILLNLSEYKDLPRYKVEHRLREYNLRKIKVSNDDFEKLLVEMSEDKKLFSIFEKGVNLIIGNREKAHPGELYCLQLIEKLKKENCDADPNGQLEIKSANGK